MKRQAKAMPQLIQAVFAGNMDLLAATIRAGADVNERGRDGRTALHHAVIDGNQDAIRHLLAFAADVNLADNDGNTALHFAANNHSVDIARVLVDAGAAIDSVDTNGNTPLSNAVFQSRGRGELILYFLSKGADRHRKNNYGVSPVDLADSIGNFNVKQWFR